MANLLALIKGGKLTGVAEQIKDLEREQQGEVALQALRCLAAQAHKSSMVCANLLHIVKECCQVLLSVDDLNILTYIKSLYYILQVAIKQNEYPTLLQLLPFVSPILSKCLDVSDTTSFLKALYQLLWNASLKAQDATTALTMQRFALILLLTFKPTELVQVASMAEMCGKDYKTRCQKQSPATLASSTASDISKDEQSNHSVTNEGEHVDNKSFTDKSHDQFITFYHQILSSLITNISRKKQVDTPEILSILNLLPNCDIHKHPNLLKFILKTFKSLCSSVCYSAVYTGVDLLHAALRMRHCDKPPTELEAPLKTLAQYSPSFVGHDDAVRTALCCLLAALELLPDTGQQEGLCQLSMASLRSLMGLLVRLPHPSIQLPIIQRVLAAECNLLRVLVFYLKNPANNTSSSSNNSAVFGRSSDDCLYSTAASWCREVEGSILALLPRTAATASHFYNLSLSCNNLGILCTRVSKFKEAVGCLKVCVALQDVYSTLSRDEFSSKRPMLCDSLRYIGRLQEAAQVLAQHALNSVLPRATTSSSSTTTPSSSSTSTPRSSRLGSARISPPCPASFDSVLVTWMKIKKEALKQSAKLKDEVLWPLMVQAAQETGREQELQKLLPVLVLQELACYNSASWDTSSERLLCCGLLLQRGYQQLQQYSASSSSGLMLIVKSLAHSAQVLYVRPEKTVPDCFKPAALQDKLRVLGITVDWASTGSNAGDTTASRTNTGSSDGVCINGSGPCCPVAASEPCPALYLLTVALAVCTHATDGTSTSLPAAWTEQVASLHFWLYLALLQEIQLTKTQDGSSSSSPCKESAGVALPPASLTAAATDQGDEQQPDDACDVRTNTVALLHSQPHRHALRHLQQALGLWEQLQDTPLDEGEAVCQQVLAAGHVYRLQGYGLHSARCWGLLVRMAERLQLHSMLLKGCSEMVWCCGEQCPAAVVSMLREELSSDRHQPHGALLARVALALYYLKHGQLEEGWPMLQRVLDHETVTEKKTVRATEVQCLAHHVASLYSMLPQHLRHHATATATQALNPVALAHVATREANALVQATADCSGVYELHWSDRMSWMLQMTSVWLAELSLLTVQPRLARAYLKLPLELAHQLNLPYWAVRVLSVLAEVDLLCDQLDDCRVKVDTLLAVFSYSCEHQQHQQQTLTSDTAACRTDDLSRSHDSSYTARLPAAAAGKKGLKPRRIVLNDSDTSSQLGKSHHLNIPRRIDEAFTNFGKKFTIEAMREAGSRSNGNSNRSLEKSHQLEGEDEDEFHIIDGQAKLGSHHLLGIEARLAHLSLASTKMERNKLDKDKSLCPGSPSLGHREAATLMPKWKKTGDQPCQSCASSALENGGPQEDAERCAGGGAAAAGSSGGAAMSAYFPGVCGAYLSTAAMLASLHLRQERCQSAEQCIHTAGASYEEMESELVQYVASVSSRLEAVSTGRSDVTAAGSDAGNRCDGTKAATPLQLLASNTFLRSWCSVQQTHVQLLAARNQWQEAARLAATAVRTAASLPPQSLVLHQSVVLPLLLQSRHLHTILRRHTQGTELAAPLPVPAVSPVARNDLQPLTPTRSPSQPAQHPPPLRRTPMHAVNHSTVSPLSGQLQHSYRQAAGLMDGDKENHEVHQPPETSSGVGAKRSTKMSSLKSMKSTLLSSRGSSSHSKVTPVTLTSAEEKETDSVRTKRVKPPRLKAQSAAAGTIPPPHTSVPVEASVVKEAARVDRVRAAAESKVRTRAVPRRTSTPSKESASAAGDASVSQAAVGRRATRNTSTSSTSTRIASSSTNSTRTTSTSSTTAGSSGSNEPPASLTVRSSRATRTTRPKEVRKE